MQYALVGELRMQAIRGAKGICPDCKRSVIAKCGPKVIHHWAHEGRRDCDSWWENETQWHRDWKARFPEDSREISHVDTHGETHRADIKTPTGIYVEVQHSPISDVERSSREHFYQNLIWVVDGKPFIKNFELGHMLPSADSEVAKDIVWFKADWGMRGSLDGIFYRKSENPEPSGGVWVKGIREIMDQIKLSYKGQHQYAWKKPRTTWLQSDFPVYLDFGDDWLLRLEKYGELSLPTVRLVSKEEFVQGCMTEFDCKSVCRLPAPWFNSEQNR